MVLKYCKDVYDEIKAIIISYLNLIAGIPLFILQSHCTDFL